MSVRASRLGARHVSFCFPPPIFSARPPLQYSSLLPCRYYRPARRIGNPQLEKIRREILLLRMAGKRLNPFVPHAMVWMGAAASAGPTSPHTPKSNSCPTTKLCTSCREEYRRRECRRSVRWAHRRSTQWWPTCEFCRVEAKLLLFWETPNAANYFSLETRVARTVI